MKIFDVHSHVQFPVYDSDRARIIERAKAVGVKMIVVGTQVSTSESAIKLAYQYPDDVWATVGFHPSHVVASSDRSVGATDGWHHDSKEQSESRPEKFDSELLRKLAKDPKVVAVGECGLDYYRLASSVTRSASSIKNLQKEIFLKQVAIAQDLKKPLMMHCRPSKGTDDAYEDLFQLLNANRYALTAKIIHFYVGSLEITKKLVEAGFYFTFGGVITFARNYDEVVKYIPLDRILLETDCPYVAPVPYRGKRNEPAYILEVARKIAELKNADLDLLVDEIYNQTSVLFGIGL